MPNNIRAYAAEIISNVIFNKQSLDQALIAKQYYFANRKDEALLQEICYGSLRFYHRINKIIIELIRKPLSASEHIVVSLLTVGIYQLLYLRIPEYAAISETVNAARVLKKPYATKLINAVLRNFLRRKDELLAKLKNTEYSHPAWFIKEMQKSWPEYWQQILTTNNEHPPMSLRINTNKISRENYLNALAEKNIAAHAAQYTATGIILEKPIDVNELPLFAEGIVYVQDIASQLAAELLELKPKQKVLDACAAPGGKLTHILQNESELETVIALDIEPQRLLKIQDNLNRLNLKDKAQLICGDAANPQKWHKGETFDRILLDAPCSATGVIRRHPDIKILRIKNDIANLQKLQLAILEALWPLLKPNGILLYSTCSIFPDENSEVIKKFLLNHEDAKEKVIAADWGIKVEYGRQIITGANSMDGFYYAKLQKMSY